MSPKSPEEHAVWDARLRMVRAYVADKLPYFSEALFAAKWVFTEQLDSIAAVDQYLRIYFRPSLLAACLAGLSERDFVQQAGWILIHEVSHCLREHGNRGGKLASSLNCSILDASASFDWKRFNVAADLEINDFHEADLSPPVHYPPLTCELFDLEPGMLAESYYQLLPESWSCLIDPSEIFNEGSGVHGIGQPWELEPSDPQHPALAPQYLQGIRVSLAKAMSEARVGSVPGSWLRWAQLYQPIVDWRCVFRNKIARLTNTATIRSGDRTYKRPHRRAVAYAPFIKPGVVQQSSIRLTIVIDTSGSITQEQLNRCMSEIQAMLQSNQSTIVVIPCDAKAYDPIFIRNKHDIHRACRLLHGGGGTDMVAGISAALELRPKPDAIVVLTDGWTPYPKQPPSGTAVFFGILSDELPCLNRMPSVPPWPSSSVIHIPLS